jgi:hypothetical protein
MFSAKTNPKRASSIRRTPDSRPCFRAECGVPAKGANAFAGGRGSPITLVEIPKKGMENGFARRETRRISQPERAGPILP